jgi:DNA-binding PadR family transcriptional regulator
MHLNASGKVILGMLSLGKQTGYDIKQLADAATRHFWAVSYGQIYPELRRLEEQGLVTSHPEPAGGRARQVYELTPAGRQMLTEWLTSPAEPLFELRCESMLKLFFSDAVDAEARRRHIRQFQELQERKLEQLRAIDAPEEAWPDRGPYLSLRFGIAMSEWIIDWCRQADRALAATVRAEA